MPSSRAALTTADVAFKSRRLAKVVAAEPHHRHLKRSYRSRIQWVSPMGMVVAALFVIQSTPDREWACLKTHLPGSKLPGTTAGVQDRVGKAQAASTPPKEDLGGRSLRRRAFREAVSRRRRLESGSGRA